MKKCIYLLCVLSFVLTACQEDKFGSKENSGSAALKLKFNTSSNLSRAVSSDEEEQRIQNAYVFIFNQDGTRVFGQFYNGINANGTHQIEIKNIPAGSGKIIAVVANINLDIFDMTTATLDAITAYPDLLALTSRMQDKFIERGAQFLMSGTTTADLTANTTNPVNVSLKRVDVKIRFNVTTAEGVTFTPLDWQVVTVPRVVSVLPTEVQGLFEFEGNYFDSSWNNFEISMTGANTFACYIPENKVDARKAIPATGTYAEQYALREKQEKTPNNDGTVTNGAYEYADERATFVKFKGNIFYTIGSGKEVSADVTYTVHLGAVNGVNDYNSLRNHFYTYNVKIVSVDDIIVEVESGEEAQEPSPGSEGDVVFAKKVLEFDAHNEVFKTVFHQSDIDQSLTWNISTPFSKGAEDENPKDYEWICFRINTKSRTTYSGDFTRYKGDNGVYTDAELTTPGYSHPLDKYMADINSGNDKMLNIKQLVSVLKECKRRYLANNGAVSGTLFDSADEIVFTTFLRDFYYEVNPENTSETVENGLWKKFVNTEKRVLNILSNLQYSADRVSTKTTALYSIRQASIQTMYNKEAAENFTAWGTEAIQDEDRYRFETTTTRDNRTYDDKDNGRANTINMWMANSGSEKWDTYIDYTTWEMKPAYNAAKYRCMRLNRDMNGDGQIDENEVQWYLASINQLTDLWIGENSFDPQARLYKRSTWEEDLQWYASSTVLEKSSSRVGGIISGYYVYRDNPDILWSSEGSSVGLLTGAGAIDDAIVYYRCVRNLGVPKNAAKEVRPDDFAIYDETTRTITLTRLDAKSIRGFKTTEELADHNERDVRGYNKPWKAFKINPTTHGNALSWQTIMARSQPGATNPVCPKGWRVPNQRELALMYFRMPRNSTSWPLTDHFAKSSFSFNPTGGNRIGFSVKNEGGVFYLLHNKSDEVGGVRCVQDVD